MASWPDAHTVFRHNAQYTLQQNANDDWDYETGAEAGYGLNNFQESTVLSNPTLASSVGEPVNPGLTEQIKVASQQPDRMPTPSEEKAAFLKAKILAKRSTSNSRATNGTSKPGTPKPATQPQTTRPVSGPSVQVKGDEAQQSASKFVDQLATAPHQRVDSNPTAKPSAPADAPSKDHMGNNVNATNGPHSSVTSPTTSSTASKAPIETLAKVKKTKKDKTTAPDGTAKLKKTRTADKKSDGAKQQDKYRSETANTGLKQTPSTASTAATKQTSLNISPPLVDNQDIADWLEFTGYYNLEHRQKLLKLHRRRREIRTELAELDSEITINNGFTVPATPTAASNIETPSGVSIKRARSPDAISGGDQGQPEKVRRVVSAQVTAADVKRFNVAEPAAPRGRARTRSPGRRRSMDAANLDRVNTVLTRAKHATRERERLSRSPVRPSYRPYSQTGIERRDPKVVSSKTWVNPTTSTSRTISNSSSYPSYPWDTQEHNARGLELRKGNCRYFMVKSWNWDNVLQAQKDGLWVTQEQNESLYADAFKAYRHVIFFFSVNNSKAFQGYAKMDCLPGNAPTPSWATSLKWPVSRPYRLRWITIADTKFRDTGDLKNSLNENMPVLVGRDGQEIEEKCGIALAELIDEDGAVQRKGKEQW